MNDFLVHIKVFDQKKAHDVWVGKDSVIDDFMTDIEHSWYQGEYNYRHFCYHVEKERILSPEGTWSSNNVLPGDHLILF